MPANFHAKKEAPETENGAIQPIASVRTGVRAKVMHVCRNVLETTNDIVRDGAELTGTAAGTVINATIGFTGALIRGATGRHSLPDPQKRSNAL